MRRSFSARILAAAMLFFAAGGAVAEGRVARPAIDIDPSSGTCIAPAAEMRRNHMEMLKHQRDRTLRQGERGAKVSLNGCVNCHASKRTGAVAGNPGDFCESCHAYAAVRIDCFECHQARAAGKVVKATAGGTQ